MSGLFLTAMAGDMDEEQRQITVGWIFMRLDADVLKLATRTSDRDVTSWYGSRQGCQQSIAMIFDTKGSE